MSLKTELADAKAALAALKERIESDDAEAIAEGVELQAQIEEKTAEIEKAEQKAALLSSIGTEPKEDDHMEVKTGFAGLIEQAKEIDRNVKGWSIGAPLDTLVKASTDVVTGVQMTDYDRNVTGNIVRRRIADLFGAITVSGNAITYFTQDAWEGDRITGTPAGVAEGAEKPQGSTGFTPHTLALSKIAGYVKETDEILEDEPFLASVVRNELLYQLAKVEDAAVLAAVLRATGIQTADYGETGDAASLVEGILYAKRIVAQNSPFAADFVVINPADMYALMTAKDENGQYMGGGYFYAPYANGNYSEPVRVWGLPVFESNDIDAGTVLVGAGKQAVNVARKGGVQVNIYEQNEDDAIHNRVTLLAEERVATYVKYPAAIVKLIAKV